jgi:hypothetical protein
VGSRLLNGSGVQADTVLEGDTAAIACHTIQNWMFASNCTI